MQISSRFTLAIHIIACIETFKNEYKVTSDFLADSTNVNKAVECVENGELFHFHENPNPKCPVGRNIHTVLDNRLDKVQQAMENELKKITLADIESDIQKLIQK